jgi:hypothetical protein
MPLNNRHKYTIAPSKTAYLRQIGGIIDIVGIHYLQIDAISKSKRKITYTFRHYGEPAETRTLRRRDFSRGMKAYFMPKNKN